MNPLSRGRANTGQILSFAWQVLLRVNKAARRELDRAISPKPVRYGETLEVRSADEDETIDRIIAAMTHESEKGQTREHHPVRASHAKATAFLKGTLQVRGDLPPELRQGNSCASMAGP